MSERWTPDSWRNKRCSRCPTIRISSIWGRSRSKLRGFPPLVFAGEARDAEGASWPRVADGEAFLLQGGDCAESFAELARRQHPRHLPRVPADGGGADLRRRRCRW
ncbi:MAG: 3-deoxy-7-phosphoheptulonate synthase [Rhodopseudomonas palustris]|nr:3-deoxy-7-phosphoheptulonate synthase [Rhodopseudomonas palustris]